MAKETAGQRLASDEERGALAAELTKMRDRIRCVQSTGFAPRAMGAMRWRPPFAQPPSLPARRELEADAHAWRNEQQHLAAGGEEAVATAQRIAAMAQEDASRMASEVTKLRQQVRCGGCWAPWRGRLAAPSELLPRRDAQLLGKRGLLFAGAPATA